EEFIIPCYDWFSVAKYLTGLTIYDWLAGKYSFGKSKFLSKKKTMELMPGIKEDGLKGAISYFDGKFDDARLAINIAQTAIEQGAVLANYMQVTNLIKENYRVIGVEIKDAITDEKLAVYANVVINATGIFVDDILKMNNPDAKKMVRPSQGVHVVLDKKFLESESALMIPKTTDGRVLFAVPWHNHLLVGTTDTPLNEHSLEPRAFKEETDFILATATSYFKIKPTEADILSVFSGLRPLAAPTDSNSNSTKEISRDHKLIVSAKGLVTITGGKWTTYRRMAEETINLAISQGGLTPKACVTKELKIHGCAVRKVGNYLSIYGTDQLKIKEILNSNPSSNQKIHPDFPYTEAEVLWIANNEMVETVE
ncbi:MAG: glycerol-3-phosphate dehydrogenase/oxidase, partial [Chitinophagaceae bacterium]